MCGGPRKRVQMLAGKAALWKGSCQAFPGEQAEFHSFRGWSRLMISAFQLNRSAAVECCQFTGLSVARDISTLVPSTTNANLQCQSIDWGMGKVWWRVSQALIRIILSCLFERPALLPSVCVCVSGYVAVTSSVLVFLKLKAADVCLLLEAAGYEMCNKKKSQSDALQKYSSPWRVGEGSYCLYLSPAHPAVSGARTLLDHKHLATLSPHALCCSWFSSVPDHLLKELPHKWLFWIL